MMKKIFLFALLIMGVLFCTFLPSCGASIEPTAETMPAQVSEPTEFSSSNMTGEPSEERSIAPTSETAAPTESETAVPTESEPSAPTESETTAPTEEYVLPPGPPYRFDLSSSNEELREFLAVAQKTEEEAREKYNERYEKYRAQKKGTPWEDIRSDHAMRIASYIADLEIPLLKEGVVCEDSVLQYYIRFALDKNNNYYEIDELQIIYTLDGVHYYFTYDFTNLRLFDLEEEPVFKDVRLDSLTFDVYQIPDSQRLYGGVVFEKYALTVEVYELPDGAVFSLDAFTFGPITDFGLISENDSASESTATQERITADPLSQSFEIRSLEELNRMREMAECKDEAQLEEYVQSIKASGIMSKDDLLAFVKIIDSLSHVSLLDGKVTWICFSRGISEDTGKETAIVYITTESANGDWTRIEYLLSVKDASKKIADEIALMGEDAALATPVKTADERLTLHAETRKAHPSGTGTMILWYGEADGIFTRIRYYTNTPENIDANELFGSLQTTKVLQ